MIAIVDYGAGNVRSVQKAFAAVGAATRLTADPAEIRAARRVVFPGQGHFGQSMARLRRDGLDRVLAEAVASGRPFLGICLGLQLLFDGSEEAPGVAGLGLLPGRCVRFAAPRNVPQIGWNSVRVTGQGSALDAVLALPSPAGPDTAARPTDAHQADARQDAHFYFVHSYHAVAESPADVAAVSDYDGDFTAAVRRDHLFAAQFHPEKSGRLGLALLRAWLDDDAAAGQGASC